LCTPPSLTAHLFYPNGSSWGGGGLFLRDHRLVVFNSPPENGGPEFDGFRRYRILHNTTSLPDDERTIVKARFTPPETFAVPQPLGRGAKPVLVSMVKPHHLGSYDQFDYVLKDASGYDMEGAEEIVLANWAGWDLYGRLMVARGRHLLIYEVKPGKPLPEPAKILDLEAAI
jgi:hypothetical protein